MVHFLHLDDHQNGHQMIIIVLVMIIFPIGISGRLSAEAQDLVAMLTTFSDGRSATTPTAIGEGKANKIVERLTRVVMKWNAYKFAYARKRYNQGYALHEFQYYAIQ